MGLDQPILSAEEAAAAMQAQIDSVVMEETQVLVKKISLEYLAVISDKGEPEVIPVWRFWRSDPGKKRDIYRVKESGRKQGMRKLRYGMRTVLLLLTFLITGCGEADNTGNAEKGAAESSNPKESTVSWQAEYFSLENQYILALASDRLYGCYVREDQVLLDIINKDDISARKTCVLPDVSQIAGMVSDQDGKVYLLGNKEEETGLWTIDAEGNLQDYQEMILEDTDEVSDLSLRGIFTNQSGYLFVWCKMLAPEIEMLEGREREVWHWEDRVYIKDGQFQTLFYEKIEDKAGTEVLNFQIGTGGEPVFVVKDSDGAYMQEIDVEQEGRKNAIRLEEFGTFFDINGGNILENIVPVEDGFLCCRDNELYEYHFDTRKVEKLFSLSTYGIFSEDLLFLAKGQDVIEIIDNHGESGHSEFISFALGETEKKTVTLGSTEMVPNLEKVAAEFNRYSNEYRVEIMDYIALAGNYDDAVEQLKLDVISGKAPDIIMAGDIDYSMFSEKGVLADLYDFMREDEQISRDMLVQSAAKAFEIEGHLYSIAPAFLIHSMWGYGDVIKGQSGVTFEELFQLLEESGKDLNAITGFFADEPVLTRLCTVSMEEFVDWESGVCSFDGDYFKKVLSFAKEYTGNDMGGSYSERIGKRDAVMSVGIISSIADYQIQKELYGGDVAFVGYPVAEGSGTAVSFGGGDIAINAGNENQEGAWEFVKFYLQYGYDDFGFPILQELFNQEMAAAMEEEYCVTEDGGTERYPKGFYGDGVTSIVVYAATREEVDAIIELVEGVDGRVELHLPIQNIINEEAEAYFAGQVDLDKTVEKIQNRISLLLQESL